MIFTKFIERDTGHISLNDWVTILKKTDILRLAETPNPHEWIGYTVNTRGSGKQFHDREERKYDCDLLLREEWKRVFYWHFIPETNEGVITFEGSSGEYYIEEVAKKLAIELNAKVEDEETTKYD